MESQEQQQQEPQPPPSVESKSKHTSMRVGAACIARRRWVIPEVPAVTPSPSPSGAASVSIDKELNALSEEGELEEEEQELEVEVLSEDNSLDHADELSESLPSAGESQDGDGDKVSKTQKRKKGGKKAKGVQLSPKCKVKRVKRADCCKYFKLVSVASKKEFGVMETKAKCKFCHKAYVCHLGGVTSQLNRHIEKCTLFLNKLAKAKKKPWSRGKVMMVTLRAWSFQNALWQATSYKEERAKGGVGVQCTVYFEWRWRRNGEDIRTRSQDHVILLAVNFWLQLEIGMEMDAFVCVM